MELPVTPTPDPVPTHERALGIITTATATATVLALLYFARGVLVPITLAVILSLLIAPLVRALRRLGLGQTWSVLAAVLVLAFSFAAVAGVIGSQLVHMAQSLPRYERTIEHKIKTLNDITVGRLDAFTVQAGRLVNRHADNERPAPVQPEQTPAAPQSANRPAAVVPIPVELHEAPPSSVQLVEKILGSIWVPIETAGIVLVILVFVLLEHEAVRDRFIRVAGGADIRLTTLAINDAGERLSRFSSRNSRLIWGLGCSSGFSMCYWATPRHSPCRSASTSVRCRPTPMRSLPARATFSSAIPSPITAIWCCCPPCTWRASICSPAPSPWINKSRCAARWWP